MVSTAMHPQEAIKLLVIRRLHGNEPDEEMLGEEVVPGQRSEYRESSESEPSHR